MRFRNSEVTLLILFIFVSVSLARLLYTGGRFTLASGLVVFLISGWNWVGNRNRSGDSGFSDDD